MMNKEERYNELAKEVTEELEMIDTTLQDTVKECQKLDGNSVIASITFKVPAFIYLEGKKLNKLRDNLNKLKGFSKELDLEQQLDEIDLALKALDNLDSSFDNEFDSYNEIDDLRFGLDMNIEPDL